MPETPEPRFAPIKHRRSRIVLFANTDWYLYNFRFSLARTAAQQFNADVWIACPDGPYRRHMEAEGIRWIPTELHRRSLNPFHDLATAWRLSRFLRHIKPDLVHAFTLKSIFIGNLATWLVGVPRMVNAITGLGSLYTGRKPHYVIGRHILGLFFKALLPREKTRTIFQNPEDLEEFKALVGSCDNFRLIWGSGVDTHRFHPSGTLQNPPVVLMASRLIRDKGIQVLCHAASLVHAQIPDVRFKIAGEVDPGNPTSHTKEEILEMARKYPMVQFLGHRSDMAELLRGTTVAVLPAQAREGLPRSLIEACASGLALVGSDVEGVRDVISHGRNGLLVPPGDASALALAILTLLNDPDRCFDMGKESRALALDRYDQQKIVEATLAVYSELGMRSISEDKP